MFMKQNTQHSWFKTKNGCVKCILSIRDPSPSVYLGDTDFIYAKKNGPDLPLPFCILQAIKNWTVGRPENQASVRPLRCILMETSLSRLYRSSLLSITCVFCCISLCHFSNPVVSKSDQHL